MKTIKCKDKEEYNTVYKILYGKYNNDIIDYFDSRIFKNDNLWLCHGLNCENCADNYANLEIYENIEPDSDDFCTEYIHAITIIREKKINSL